jgi:predicted alpha-1,6-mannanase (GH76 family)
VKLPSIIVSFFACVVTCAAVPPGDDFNADTTAAISTLQQWYGAKGLWKTTRWWNAANCVDALESGAAACNGADYLGPVAHTFKHNSARNYLNNFYDDEGWWVETWIQAYDLTGDVGFLKMARTIFADMTNGWDSECGGGLWWKKDRRYKNAIPNELFLLAAVRLHQRTPGDSGPGSYYYWATNEWNWFSNSGMINEENLINDGLTADCVNNGQTTWTYNQGVILAGLVDLYKVTGNTNYLSRAETLADAAIRLLVDSDGVLREPHEVPGSKGLDVPQFKGIFARHLAYLYDEDHKPAYNDFLHANAHSVWANDRNDLNQLGLIWNGPFDCGDAGRQSSAIMPLAAVAEPFTALLPFAKGSGNPAFGHQTGQAAGTLAWNCGPANRAGLMQSGPSLASLPKGAHVVHFRLAVNVPGHSTAPIARLFVMSQERSLVQYNVNWDAFTQPDQPQDFPLAFTNSAAGNSLEFRILWIPVASGPILTASDITIDGDHNWTAANLSHGLGRLDGLNAWEADPVRDAASGYLVTGPGTPELSPGAYTAYFELKVDNFNWDNAAVATLSVVDTDSNTVVASRSITRSAFPNMLYQAFALNFQAVAGAHYDFRTYWDYSTCAPRLTQRSVVVASHRAGPKRHRR